MKQRIQGIVIGFVAAVILSSLAVWAAAGTQSIEVTYRDIKLYVDGAFIIPKDPNGNVVEPFIYNGTTYLPIRAVGEALGRSVEWEGDTSSIYIGGRGPGAPDNYLDKLQYTNFKGGNSENKFYLISGAVSDLQGNSYTNGIILHAYNWNNWAYNYSIEGDSDYASTIIDYPLNGQYTTLNGKIVVPVNIDIAGLKNAVNKSNNAVDVLFYGDGKLLHSAVNVTTSMPFNFSVNVNGVLNLTIKMIVKGEGEWNRYVALTDLALYK